MESGLDKKIKTLATKKKETKTLATKAVLKAEHDKTERLQTHNLGYFLRKNCFDDEGFQSIFVYQPAFNVLELKKDQDTDYILSWKSNGVYTSKLKQLHTAFLQSIKLSGYKVRIKFNKNKIQQLCNQNCKSLHCL